MDIMKSEYTGVQKARIKLLENRKWINDHIKELQGKHLDKWVCVLDAKVVAHGDTFNDVRDVPDDKKEEAVILRIPEKIEQII